MHTRQEPGTGDSTPLLEVTNLVKAYPVRGRRSKTTAQGRTTVRAVDGISFELDAGETLGLVGESGSGKSSVARTLTMLTAPTEGAARLRGEDLFSMDRARLRKARREVQMVFQDPFASLNPRMTVGSIIAEPLRVNPPSTHDPSGTRSRVEELLELVGLKASDVDRYPYEFSGGQCQRIGIARALSLNPALVIADEPVSALDVSVQAQIINLLQRLQDELGVSYIFIAHDLSVVRHTADRVAVMYLGRIVEIGHVSHVFDHPAHPYTSALLSAEPTVANNDSSHRERIVLTGDLPSPLDIPDGCRFRTRCWLYEELQRTAPAKAERCIQEDPVLATTGHTDAACHFPLTN